MIEGMPQVMARIEAISSVHANRQMLGRLGLSAVAEQKLLVHRKTGNTGRTIHMTALGEDSVTTRAGGAAVFLERGTRAHEITPRVRRALRWAASPAGRRLTGSPRIGAAVVFAKRVHHPGTKPYPFMVPGAEAAIRKFGFADTIIRAWNGAA